MLKVEIPIESPDIWVRIKELRRNDTKTLAPKFRERLTHMIANANGTAYPVVYKDEGETKSIAFDPIIFETWREDELQQIYFAQKTTKAATAIYGWHYFGLAADCISKAHEWEVPDQWWERLANTAEHCDLLSGRRWRRPDNPHVYFGTLKKSPSDLARTLYFGTKHWQGLPLPTGPEHEAGLIRLWEEVGAI